MDVAAVHRVLGLRPGEGRPVGLAVAMSFVVSAGLMIGQSGIEALFFARYGVEKLPAMYLVLGGTMFLATVGFGVLLDRLGRGRACLVIPLALAGLVVAGRVGLAADLSWITQALWLLQGAGYFLMGLSVWGLAGIVTDTRQAKRFFPLIGAGGVLGYVLGGLVTKPLASSFGTANLLLVWIATLVAAALLGATLLEARAGDGARRGRESGALEQLRLGLRYVRRSALLRWLALAAILFSLLFFSLYLPFSRAATLRYPDPDDLAGFFGLFFGLSTGAAFLLSLFVTNRLLARFGVPTVMLVLPVLYAVTFGVLTVDASFAALAIFRFAQVAWLQGGASSSWEAVINTVPPERRDQTRAFLYGGPTQVGTVLAGVVALIGERALSPTTLYAIGLASATLAIAAMLGVRRAYPRELVRALREGRPSVFGAARRVPTEPFGLARSDSSALGVAVTALADQDPRMRRVAALALGDLDPAGATEPLVTALRDDDADVRATAIRSLANIGAASALADILERSVDADAVVRLATVDAIGTLDMQVEAVSHAVGPLMHDRDPFVRARAAAALVRRTGDRYAVAILVELAADNEAGVRIAAFEAMHGVQEPGLAEAAHEGLNDAAPAVRVAAAGAVATITPAEALGALLPMLADESPAVGAAAAAALGRLPLDGGSAEIERFAAQAVDEAVEHHRLGAAIDDDDERLELLRDSLLDRSDRDALIGLRAAALLGGGTAMDVALENLSGADPAQRANALEVIESVARRDLVRPLVTIWDGPSAHIDTGSTLERLRTDPDDWIRACAEFATAPRGGTMTQTLTTLAPMERVLFLRKVPLFATLPPPDLLPVASIAEEHAFADGDAIARQGDAGHEMHIIVSGEVAVTVRHGEGDGEERVVAVRSAGDVVGEMSILTNEPRIADLVARGSVRMLTIDRRRFESILRERPETSLAVIRVLCRRLAEAPTPPQIGEDTDTTTASTS